MKHVIKTQVFEVLTNKNEDNFVLHQQMREFFFQILLPLIENIFDQLSPDDRLIHLEKVEIDLGSLNSKELRSANSISYWREIIYSQLQQVIFRNDQDQAQQFIHYSVAQQWLYYMKRGWLPWNTVDKGADWYQKVLEGLAIDYNTIQEFRSLILNDPNALRRITLLHRPEYLSHLVEVLVAIKQDRLLEIIELLRLQPGTESEAGSSKHLLLDKIRRVWEAIFKMVAALKRKIKTEEIIEFVISTALEIEQVVYLQKQAVINKQLEDFLPLIEQRLKKQDLSVVESNTVDQTIELQKKITKLPGEGIFVVHAGLVLLHPFLNIFFRHFRLTSGKDFISFDHQQKAVILLHYLATGKTEFEDHELVIEKLLCSCPLEFPIDPAIELSPEELSESELLLKEVVAQWKILKNTSPDGLRINFLQRPGKLLTRNNEPCLLVESNVLDVLLDHLPWSISMIKLPWMLQVLKVQWT